MHRSISAVWFQGNIPYRCLRKKLDCVRIVVLLLQHWAKNARKAQFRRLFAAGCDFSKKHGSLAVNQWISEIGLDASSEIRIFCRFSPFRCARQGHPASFLASCVGLRALQHAAYSK
jgi:hypothetical protein